MQTKSAHVQLQALDELSEREREKRTRARSHGIRDDVIENRSPQRRGAGEQTSVLRSSVALCARPWMSQRANKSKSRVVMDFCEGTRGTREEENEQRHGDSERAGARTGSLRAVRSGAAAASSVDRTWTPKSASAKNKSHISEDGNALPCASCKSKLIHYCFAPRTTTLPWQARYPTSSHSYITVPSNCLQDTNPRPQSPLPVKTSFQIMKANVARSRPSASGASGESRPVSKTHTIYPSVKVFLEARCREVFASVTWQRAG